MRVVVEATVEAEVMVGSGETVGSEETVEVEVEVEVKIRKERGKPTIDEDESTKMKIDVLINCVF